MKSIVRHAAVLAAVVVGAFAATQLAQSALRHATAAPSPSASQLANPFASLPAGFGADAAVTTAASAAFTGLQIGSPAARPAVQRASLAGPSTGHRVAAASSAFHAALLIDGVAAPVQMDQPVALPDGSRFQLRLQGVEGAQVEVHAVNPDGEASAAPLWSGWVPGGASVHTPHFRLAGTRGLETLQVVWRPTGHSAAVVQQVQLLHR